MRRVLRGAVVALPLLLAASAGAADAPVEKFVLRGQEQPLRLYGTRGGPVAIVASGDGGWVHLGPDVAAFLAQHGYFVVGLDVKHYLSSFTKGQVTLTVADVPGDFKALLDHAAAGGTGRPVLVGVSEGAALAVLAATDPAVKATLGGVLALGLPNTAELGWRFRDQLIYLTKGNPDEPTFDTQDVVARMAPCPLAAIHSTKDEYVPLAEAQAVVARAGEPKKLWVVAAADHRFSDATGELDRRLLEALGWMKEALR